MASDLTPRFELFGPEHLATLGIVIALAFLVPIATRRLAPGAARQVGWGLAGLLLTFEWSNALLRAQWGATWTELLPLHLCGMAVYLVAWALVTRSPRVYEVVYFWGLAGTTQALLTPDLTYSFPHVSYLFFFAVHGLIVIGVVYCAIALQLRPYPSSIPRVAAITLAYAAAVFPVNLLLGTNYLYLMEKPGQSSLLDWLGPWPWYLVPATLVGFVLLFVWYTPFLVLDRWRRP